MQPLRPGDPGYIRIQHENVADDFLDRIRANNAKYKHTNVVEDRCQIAAWACDPTRATFIAEVERPGVWLFLNVLEYRVFPPSTPLNAAYQLALLSWEGVAWCLLFVPLLDDVERAVAEIAAESRLRIEDAVPLCCRLSRTTNAFGYSRPGRPAVAQMQARGPVTWFPVALPSARSLTTLPGIEPYTKEQQEVLCKTAYWEWEELHGKHAGKLGEVG